MNVFTILIIIFVLLIYSLICFYIGYNGWAWLKSTTLPKFKKTYIGFIIFLSTSIFAGRLLPISMVEVIGSYWMIIFAFSLILLPIANILAFIVKKKGVFWIGMGVFITYLLIIGIGSFNAWSPVVKTLDIKIEKKADYDNLKILMASDLHLSAVVGVNHLERFVKIVEEEKPDIVMLPGDIINDNIGPFLKHNMGEILGGIEAPLGVYAVMGNHDYYGNDMEKLSVDLEKNGITVLLDEFMLVDDQFYVAGRREHTDHHRKNLSAYLVGLDHKKPIIMMDHQPKDLDEVNEHGVDILLSGHTHGGQIYPGRLITKRIYENDYGHLQKGSLHSIVSSGFGLWGPPIRIGTRSEVMIINVEFNN